MAKYDPDVDPQADRWLATADADRLAAVEKYHRRHRVPLAHPRLHATFHLIVENQLALGEQVVIDTLSRLRSEGLSRHDALHAICMVLAEHVYEVITEQDDGAPDINQPYLDRLRRLTADEWRHSQDEEG